MSSFAGQELEIDTAAFDRELEALLSEPELEGVLKPGIRRAVETSIHQIIEYEKEYNPKGVTPDGDWVSAEIPVNSQLLLGSAEHGSYTFAKVMERQAGSQATSVETAGLAKFKIVYFNRTIYPDGTDRREDAFQILFMEGQSDVPVFYNKPDSFDGHRDESVSNTMGHELNENLRDGLEFLKQADRQAA